MMHSFEGLADEISVLLKNAGDSGDTGDRPKNASPIKDIGVTKLRTKVSPNEKTLVTRLANFGDAKSQPFQTLKAGVTSVTSVTKNFDEGRAADVGDEFPSEWHAILAELKERESPDWMSPDEWKVLLHDAARFLDRWSSMAHAMGWTAPDLFGAHPTRPAVRFDVMGLILLVRGGAVVALTAGTATIRRRSGAILTYRRCDRSGAVLISEVLA